MSVRIVDRALVAIASKIEAGVPLDAEDGLALFRTRDIHTLGRLATAAKERKSGNNEIGRAHV